MSRTMTSSVSSAISKTPTVPSSPAVAMTSPWIFRSQTESVCNVMSCSKSQLSRRKTFAVQS